MEVRVNKKENIYFGLKVLFTPIITVAICLYINSLTTPAKNMSLTFLYVVLMYVLIIWAFIFFQKIAIIAHMKGNGIEISENQFQEIYKQYLQMASDLGIKRAPKLFILQEGGLLNAFAIRFSRKNYIAIYSDVFALIETDIDAVRFVLGHELGHVKRAHISKRFWTFPSLIVPFLSSAYSKSCEYTCDNVGNDFSPNNPINGLLVLAAGTELYKKVNIEGYIEDANKNNTMSVKFMGLFASHPYLPKRIQNLK